MIQYAYGNFKHEGFRYVSSSPDFFADAGRQAQLAHLHQFDTAASRGESKPGEYRCYLMTASNLNTPGEATRLYYQASSLDPFRTAIFLRGYVSEATDADVFGTTLLRLLRADIPTLRKTEKDLSALSARLDPAKLPTDISLKEKEIPEELLRRCLRTLITDRDNGKNLYIRLHTDGTEAMDYSRGLLYALYSRLPYDVRERNGFFTGLSAAVQNDGKNALPAGIHVFLLDKSSDASVRKSIFTESMDLSVPVSDAPGTDERYEAFLRFLLRSSEEARTTFFAELDAVGRKYTGLRLTRELYGLLYFLYSRKGQSLDRGSIQSLIEAVSSLDRKGQERSFMLSIMREWVPLDSIKNAFLASVTAFSSLWELGNDGKKYTHGSAVQQSDTGVLWQLLSAYLQLHGEDTRTALENELYAALKEQYSRLLQQDCPSLCTTMPRAEDIQRNAAIPDFGQSSGMVQRLWAEFGQLISERKNKVAEIYRENHDAQLFVGNEQIAGVHTTEPEVWVSLLSALEENYLYPELFEEAWREDLAAVFMTLLRTETNGGRERPSSLRENMQSIHGLLAEKGASLTEAEETEYRLRMTLLTLLPWRSVSDTWLLTMPDSSEEALRQLMEPALQELAGKVCGSNASWYFDTDWNSAEAQSRCESIGKLRAAGIGSGAFSTDGTDSFSAADLGALLKALGKDALDERTMRDAETLLRRNEALSAWLCQHYNRNSALAGLLLRLDPHLACEYNDILSFEEIRPYLFYLRSKQLQARYSAYIESDVVVPENLHRFLAAGLSITNMVELAPEEKKAAVRRHFGVDGPILISSPTTFTIKWPEVSSWPSVLPALSALALALSLSGLTLGPIIAAAVALLLVSVFCWIAPYEEADQKSLSRKIGFCLLPGFLLTLFMLILELLPF